MKMKMDEIKSSSLQPIRLAGTESIELLRAEIQKLAENPVNKYNVPATILQSDAYCKLQERVEKRKIIQDSEQLWDEVEKIVTSCSPDFRQKLNLLTSGNLTVIDFHTALLLKCGIKPSNMAILVGRSQGSIVSRRETLGRKIVGEKLTLAIMDRIIQSL